MPRRSAVTEVVAGADTLDELKAKPEVADTDTLAHVPDPSRHFYRCDA